MVDHEKEPMRVYMPNWTLLQDVIDERQSQETKWPGHTAADPIGNIAKLSMLGEEYGEVCRELCEAEQESREPDVAKLRGELIQVAAIAIAWLESLEE